MNEIVHELTLDLYGPVKKYAVEAHQGDRRTRKILIKVEENGEPFETPAGAEYILQIRKPNRVTVYVPSTRQEDGRIMCVLKADTLDRAGMAYADLVMNENAAGQTLTTQAFEIAIQRKAGAANAIEATEDIVSMEEQIERNRQQLISQAELIEEQQGLINRQATKIETLQQETAQAVNGAYYDEKANELHMTHNGEDIENSPFTVASEGGGGPGGGSARTYKISVDNATTAQDGSLTTVINVTDGADPYIAFIYTSAEPGNETNTDGAGTAQLIVGGAAMAGSYAVPQGVVFKIGIKKALEGRSGDVRVGVRLTNTEGSTKTLYWTASITKFTAETTFEDGVIRSTAFQYPWKLIGGDGTSLEKTPHFAVDGVELEDLAVPVKSNAQRTSTVRAAAGGHVLTFWGTAIVNGAEIMTSVFKHAVIVKDVGMEAKAVAATINAEEFTQGDVMEITFQAYDPEDDKAAVTIEINGKTVHSASVDRTQQTWTTREYPAGSLSIVVRCGTATAQLTAEVEALDMLIEESTNELKMDMRAANYSSANPMKLVSDVFDDAGIETTITATMEGFGVSGDITRRDENGDAYIPFFGGRRMTVPCYPFESNPASPGSQGLTLEFDLMIHDVADPDAKLITCIYESGGTRRGIYFTATELMVLSANMQDTAADAEQNEDGSATDKEATTAMRAGVMQNAKRHVGLVIWNSSGNRLVFVYIDGVPSYFKQYAVGDDFSQATPAAIVIGSDDAAVDFYRLRWYATSQSTAEQLAGYVCSQPTANMKQDAYQANNLTTAADFTGDLDYEKCVTVLPCFTVEIEELPNDTSKKPEANIVLINPTRTELSAEWVNALFAVQGTSTVVFPVKNWKWTVATAYSIDGVSRPVFVICVKKDYMESSGSYNAGNCAMIRSLYRYNTPAVEHKWADGYVAQETVTGYHCLGFWRKPGQAARRFIGRYFIMPDKSNPEHWGFDATEMTSWKRCQAWELNGNNLKLCSFKATLEDFEPDAAEKPTSALKSRYTPDGAKDHWTELKPLYAWINEIDPAKATNEAFEEERTVVDGRWVYSKETATVRVMPEEDVETSFDAAAHVYKMITWKQASDGTVTRTTHKWAMENPAEYTFTADTAAYRRRRAHAEIPAHFDLEHLLVYDLYCYGSLSVDSYEKNAQLVSWDGVIWWFQMYDDDTSWGLNNSGRYRFKYSAEFLDTIGSGYVFNGWDSVIFNLVHEVFTEELSTRWAEMRTADPALGYAPMSVEAVMATIYDPFAGALPEIVQAHDAEVSYIQPLLGESLDPTKNGKDYSYANRGKGRDTLYTMAQRRINYLDGKFEAADWLTNYAYCRITDPSDTTDAQTRASVAVVPPSNKVRAHLVDDGYLGAMYGRNTPIYSERVRVAASPWYEKQTDSLTSDKEFFVYGADMVDDFGDWSPYYAGEPDVSRCRSLKTFRLGNAAQGYCNKNALDLTVAKEDQAGNLIQGCTLMEHLDVQNLPYLSQIVGFKHLISLKTFLAAGSGLRQFHPAEAAPLENVRLGSEIVDIKLVGVKTLESMTATSWSKVQMLWVDSCEGVPFKDIIMGSAALDRVYLRNIDADTEDDRPLRKLLECRGWDENGTTTNVAYVTGKWHMGRCNSAALEQLRQQFPYLEITADKLTFAVTFYNKDGSEVLDVQEVEAGEDAVNPANTEEGDEHHVAAADLEWPTDERLIYDFMGWDTTYTNVQQSLNVYAIYRETPVRYTVQFQVGDQIVKTLPGHDEKNADGTVNRNTIGVVYGGEAEFGADPADPTGQDRFFTGWLPDADYITADTVCVAQFEKTISSATGIAFEDATWGQIKAITEAGLAKQYVDDGVWWLKAGKNVRLRNGETIRLRIAGVEKDVHADTGEKVPLTLAMSDGLKDPVQFNSGSRYFYRYAVNGSTANSADFTYNYTGGAGKVPILSIGKGILGAITVTPQGGSPETWSFAEENDEAADHVFSGTVSGEVKTWEGLEFDTTAGKLERVEPEGFTWFTNGAFVNIPVTGKCTIRVTTVFAGSSYTNGGWTVSELKEKCDPGGSIFELLPATLRKLVKPVVKLSNIGGARTDVRKSRSWIWLFSVNEVAFRSTGAGYANETGPNDQYTIFSDNASRVVHYGIGGNTAIAFLRSCNTGYAYNVHLIHTNGALGHIGANSWYAFFGGLCI